VSALDEAFALMVGHRQGTDDCGRTFERLVRKHILGRWKRPAVKALRAGALTGSREHWAAERIAALYGVSAKAGAPRRTGDPLVILRLGGADMLIDGHRRAAQMLREGAPGHDVIVIEEAGQ